MAICSAIHKYGIHNFSLYILEVIATDKSVKYLSEREDYWYNIINPSYNIQTIIKPFTGINHYRYGKKVSEAIKFKISNTLKGRERSEVVKLNHVLGARKKKVYCFDWETSNLLMEFEGIRIMERAVNKSTYYIRETLDKDKPFFCNINNINYKMFLKSSLFLIQALIEEK
uniref:GIY-YIG homing endonuclease n=1 Tax=Myochromella boudieri TaxID=117066 RepID=A0A386TY67_9AGAR|nr:GIY-YIG homing endonuclease [Myochromella boudieri]AYE93150.1 GIY-YIG homing endonuclease [Myochromella boudieri]